MEQGTQPNSKGRPWAVSPAQIGRDFQRAREGSKEFDAAWKITKLAESRPGSKGLSARMAEGKLRIVISVLSDHVWSVKKGNDSNLYLNKIGFLGSKSFQYLLENSV